MKKKKEGIIKTEGGEDEKKVDDKAKEEVKKNEGNVNTKENIKK
jgi:hypothetical protein